MRSSRTLLFALGCTTLGIFGFADEWPRFRGPHGSGVAHDQNLPEDWNPETGENVIWSVAIDGLAHSSPIVWGDRVYLTTAIADTGEVTFGTGDYDVVGSGSVESPPRQRWEILALDKRRGEVVWRRTVYEGVPRVQRHVKASHASATPATDGERIVSLFGSEGLFCFDMDGRLLWRTDVGILDVGYWGEPEIQWGPASSPVLYDDLVIVKNDRQRDSFIAAYDLGTGDEVWRTEREEKPSWSTPLVYRGEHGDELVTNGGNWIRSNDPRTGRELWRISHEDLEVITPSPIASGDAIVVTGGHPTGGRAIVALRPGEPDERIRWASERGSPYTTTPLYYDGILYVIVDNGILSAYEPETGERIYRTRVTVGAGFSASPVAADGKIYLASEDGNVFIVRAGREYECLNEIDMGEALMATPAISDGMMFVRGRRHLFAVSES